MKKTAVLLSIVLLVATLSGCYKSDTVVDVGYNDKVEVTSTLMMAPEVNSIFSTINASGGYIETLDAMAKALVASEGGNEMEYAAVDENGNALPEDTAVDSEQKVLGRRLRMKFNNFGEITTSQMISQFLPTQVLIAQAGAAEGETSGLKIGQTGTLLGTKYTVSGTFNLYGSIPVDQIPIVFESLKGQKEQMDAEVEKLKDDASKKEEYENMLKEQESFGKMLSDYEAMQAKVNETGASITFKFPLGVVKSNADEKNLFGNTMTWTASQEAPTKDVYFEVTVINPLILGMAIVILILLAIIIVLSKKKKDTPDAFFVDADGNEIPVFDTVDDENDEEDAVEEAEEGLEEDAEALSLEDLAEIVEEDEKSEEITEE